MVVVVVFCVYVCVCSSFFYVFVCGFFFFKRSSYSKSTLLFTLTYPVGVAYVDGGTKKSALNVSRVSLTPFPGIHIYMFVITTYIHTSALYTDLTLYTCTFIPPHTHTRTCKYYINPHTHTHTHQFIHTRTHDLDTHTHTHTHSHTL